MGAASDRQAIKIAEALQENLTTRYRRAEITVLALEADEQQRPALTIASHALLELDARDLRAVVDTIADSIANAVVLESINDSYAIARWMGTIRGEN